MMHCLKRIYRFVLSRIGQCERKKSVEEMPPVVLPETFSVSDAKQVVLPEASRASSLPPQEPVRARRPAFGEGLDIGCGIVMKPGRNDFVLLNTLTGKERMFVSDDRKLLVSDKDIDLDSIRRELHNYQCAETKIVTYHFGRYSDFKDGYCALSWTLYPDGRYFADEDGFGMENHGEEKVYAIINTDFEIIVPFQPMDDVKARLESFYKTQV